MQTCGINYTTSLSASLLFLFYVYGCSALLYVCAPLVCTEHAKPRKYQILRNWSYRWLWATMWVLESSGRIAVILTTESCLWSAVLILVEYIHILMTPWRSFSAWIFIHLLLAGSNVMEVTEQLISGQPLTVALPLHVPVLFMSLQEADLWAAAFQVKKQRHYSRKINSMNSYIGMPRFKSWL